MAQMANNLLSMAADAAAGGAFGKKTATIINKVMPPPPADRGLPTPIQAAPTPSPATTGPKPAAAVVWYKNRKIQLVAGAVAVLALVLFMRRK